MTPSSFPLLSCSPLPIILACVFGVLFSSLLLGLLIFYIRRRRARRRDATRFSPYHPPRGEGILSDRRISSAFSRFPSRASTSSYTPEPTFIQPALESLGAGVGGIGRALTSREKRLTMRRAGGANGAGRGEESMLGMGGEEDYGDEVLRRKMEGWNAVARRPPSVTAEEKDLNPFKGFNNPNSARTLPSLPPPLRLPLTITTSLAPPRSARPFASSPHPVPSPVSALSPQSELVYSPTTTTSPVEQADDGGVSLMGASAQGEGQAPPAYQWH